MKQTAVEWLEDEIRWYISNDERLYDMFKKAKQMEKEQMIELWNIAVTCESFEQYYNETFKSK
jgi:beta-glucanase (GH16 family)